MKLLFCGDVVVNSNNISVSNELLNYFKQFDYRICNFEGPMINNQSKKIVKCGPHVNNEQNSITFLKTLNFNCVALANNHILDYGCDSLAYTINILNQNKIKTFGAGLSFEEAYKTLVLENKDEKICIINACQAEFGVLKYKQDISSNGGYAWINSPEIKKIIKENIIKYDKTILFIHAGMEDQIIPLPEWKQIFHEFAEIINGNGIIVATHPHIVQGFENYNNTPIYYSMGNFLFYKEELQKDIEWNRSLVISYDTIKNVVEYRPVSIKDRIIDFEETENFNLELKHRCELIQNDKELNKLANQIANETWYKFYKTYYELINIQKSLDSCSIKDIFNEILIRIIHKFVRNYKRQNHEKIDEIMLLHNIQIESHRWCVERYLYNNYLKK